MRTKLLTLLLLLLLGTSSAFCQSLYQDAKKLSNLIKARQFPTLSIESNSIGSRLLINGQAQSIVTDIPMIELGVYSIQNVGAGGRAIIKMDTAEYIIPIKGSVSIENNPTNIYWGSASISENYPVEETVQFELLEDGVVGKSDGFAQKGIAYSAGQAVDIEKGIRYEIVRTPFKIIRDGIAQTYANGVTIKLNYFDDKLHVEISSETNRIDKTAFIEELALLGVHNSFLKNQSADYRITQTTADYESNPYLAPMLNSNMATAYSNNIDNPEWGNNAYNKSTEALLQQDYAWQNVLYGTEKLDLRNRISIKDVKASYRQEVAPKDLLINMSERQYADGKAFLGNLDATTLVVGVSQFVEERTQEELNIAFLDRFKKSLNGDSELSILFPNTVSLFNQFEVSNYRTLLENARNSFKNDLEYVGLSFPKLLKLPKYEYLNNSPEIYNLALIYELTNLVYKDVPVDTILLMAHQELDDRAIEMTDSIWTRMGSFLVNQPSQANVLGNQVSTYCDEVGTCLSKLASLNRRSQAEMMELKGLAALVESEIFNVKASVVGFPSFLDLKPASSYVDPLVASMLEYEDKLTGTNDYAYNFYKNKITNNLRGVEYYDYIIEKGDISAYDQSFSQAPTASTLTTNGLKYAQEMIDFDMEEDIISFQEELAADIEAFEIEYIEDFAVQESQDLSRQLERLNLKRQYLLATLESEISWWQGSKNENYYVQAFRNLFNLLSEEQVQWADLYAISFSPSALDEETLENGMSEVEYEVLREGERYFKEILDRYDDKRKELYEQKNLQISSSFDRYQSQKDSIRSVWLEEQAYSLSVFFLKRRAAINDFEESKDWESFDMSFSESLAGLVQTNTEAAIAYTAGVKALSEPNEFDYTTKIKNSANPFRTGIDIIQAEREAKLSRNLENLRSIKSDIDSIGIILKGALVTQKNAIQGQLDTMEQGFAKESHIKSRDNALQLGKALEASIHILYALKDNTIHTDTLFTRDTTVLSYTLVNTDGLSVNFDSLRVSENARQIPQARRKFISKEDYELMLEDPIMRDAFLGLLYQRLSKLDNGLSYSAESVAIVATKFINSLLNIDGLAASIKEKKRYGQSLGFEDYYPAIRTSVDLINTVITTPVNGLAMTESNNYISTIPKLSGEALSLYENIYSESYSNAIYNAMELFKVITDTHLQRNGIDKKEQRRTERVRNSILLYGTFMAAVLDARAPEDVRDALRAAALPAGSSRIKRETKYNVALNTYFSPIVALETLEGESVGTPSVGLSVPIGLSFSKAFKNRSSLTLFVSGLDIGAVTAFRIGMSEDVALLPELSFKNFIAPGVSGMYNFKNSPFSIGAGWQNGPQLRKIGDEMLPASRWMLHVGIDLPIFNLYSGAKL